MNIEKNKKDGQAFLKITDAVTIYEAGELRDAFISSFEQHNGLILDLSGVTELDTAAIQVLCSARATADSEGKRFKIEGISELVFKAIATCGLTLERIFHQEEEVADA
jgi:anti-anti-sigma factor